LCVFKSEIGPHAERNLAAFDEKLSMIAKLALRLNATVGGDWETTVVQPDEVFDPETMIKPIVIQRTRLALMPPFRPAPSE
jgi:hypothetical protein